MDGWEDIQNRKYPPVGRCIYCGSDGGPDGLRDEHMIPYSLGSYAELQEASCRNCEKETSYIDGYLSRNTFYELRAHVGAPSRRKLPLTLWAKVLVGDQEFIREFLAADQPYALMLPIWDLPGILRQVQPSPDFSVYNLRAYSFIPKNFRKTLGLAEGAPDPMVQIPPGEINNIAFARAIAKIAYCYAIAKYGLNGFRHLVLPDLILGKYPWCRTSWEVSPAHPRHATRGMYVIWLVSELQRGAMDSDCCRRPAVCP